MAEPVAPLDRRQRRRQESIEEILDVALDLMAENGVAGLSLGEIARRMGIRPPSLYVYFESKDALYDALFARGAREVLDAVTASQETARDEAESLESALLILCTAWLRWAMANQVYAQLLFWRPVPGFEPSEQAYAPAIELIERGIEGFTDFQRRGWIRKDVPIDQVLRDWTIVTSGIVGQQLSNEPHKSFETGRFSSAVATIAAMFAEYYAAPTRPPSTKPARKARP
jgi:AcrR family transcriptional regulator